MCFLFPIPLLRHAHNIVQQIAMTYSRFDFCSIFAMAFMFIRGKRGKKWFEMEGNMDFIDMQCNILQFTVI